MSTAQIALYGAAGHTARFVARELEHRGLAPVSIVRDTHSDLSRPLAGAGVQLRSASCDDPDALDRALAGTRAVINCAGPFADTAPALVEAALRLGIHYLDVTAEQRCVRQTLATYHDEARDRGVVILPAMAFFGGLADLLATQLCRDLDPVESIEIGVALDSWHPTKGTRMTGARNSARRLVVADGRLVPQPSPAPGGHWSFPEPFLDQPVVGVPLSEIITIAKHIRAARVRSFMNATPLQDLRNASTPAPAASDEAGRSSQRFVVDVIARSDQEVRRLAASGQDIYAVSAPLVAEACVQILTYPGLRGGAYAPGEILDPQRLFLALKGEIEVSCRDGLAVPSIP